MKKNNLIILSLLTNMLFEVAVPAMAAPASAVPGAASPAVSCEEAREKLRKLDKSILDMKKLLKANQDFMTRLNADDTSKKIKVSSNIMIATIQIETMTNNIEVLKKIMNTCVEPKS